MSSSFDALYKKLAASLQHGGTGSAHEAKVDPVRHASPVVAHELNNLLTIIHGYAQQIQVKRGDNPALEGQLKLIAEASNRAANIVRGAAMQEPTILPPKDTRQSSKEAPEVWIRPSLVKNPAVA